MSGRFFLAALAMAAASASGMVVMRHTGWQQGYAASQLEAERARESVAYDMRDAGFCRWVKVASAEQHCP